MATLTILESRPAPGGGPAGLAYDGRHLWNADFATGFIYRLDPESGEVTDRIICPGVLSGLAWDGSALWQGLMDEGWLRQINPQTHDYDRTIVIENPGRLSGVAWDGQQLWAVSQQRGALLAIDREDGRVTRTLDIPIAAGGLTYGRDTLWLSFPDHMLFDGQNFTWATGTERYALAQFDPQSGRELARYEMDSLALGLAWIGDELWLTSAAHRQLYRASLP